MKVLDMDPQASELIIQTLLDHPLESGLLPISVDKKEKNIIIYPLNPVSHKGDQPCQVTISDVKSAAASSISCCPFQNMRR
jgi:hypothetical protein